MNIMLLFSACLLILIEQWTTAEFIYGNFFEYSRNLTAVYSDPLIHLRISGRIPAENPGDDLIRTAVFYLDELMELEEALKDKDEEPKAMKMLSELYHSGGPKHLKKIPYARFIDTYNWTDREIDDYARYIEITAQSWDRLLQVIKAYIESGRISAK